MVHGMSRDKQGPVYNVLTSQHQMKQETGEKTPHKSIGKRMISPVEPLDIIHE